MWEPALAAVLRGRSMFGESARLPPRRKWHRVKVDVEVTVGFGRTRLEPEQILAQRLQMRDNVGVVPGDGKPNALRMQRAVAHEVTDELRQFGCHDARNTRVVVGCPVELSERRKRHLARLANEALQHERDAVTSLDLGEAPPDPVSI